MARTWSWWHSGHNGTHETYALTCAEFDQLVRRTTGRCDRCGVPYQNLVIDHDHARGQRAVRGMLCHPCNWLLGAVDAGGDVDESTAVYLLRPFHELIPDRRPRDPGKRARLSPPPASHTSRQKRPAHRTGARTGHGNTPVRNVRISDAVYDPARRIADARGESLTDVVIQELVAYVKAHRQLVAE